MVIYVVDSFQAILDNYERCRYGTYQLQEVEGGKIILRVRVGSLGYEKTFNSKDDEDLKEKLEILKSRGFYKVIKAVPEDAFFG